MSVAVCSMLCTDGLLLHLVGKGHLLVCSGASYSNGKLGDSIWESHHKVARRGRLSAKMQPYGCAEMLDTKKRVVMFGYKSHHRGNRTAYLLPLSTCGDMVHYAIPPI